MRRAPHYAALLSFALSALACSAESTGTSSSTNGTSPSGSASCSDVCSAIRTQCAVDPPACESTCSSFSDATKKCIVAASTCQAVDGCSSARGEEDDAPSTTSSSSSGGSSSGSSNPCDACKSDQFCVSASSVSSELGCVDAPSTCNGSASDLCACLMQKGTGPCSKGGKNCTQGIANRIQCL